MHEVAERIALAVAVVAGAACGGAAATVATTTMPPAAGSGGSAGSAARVAADDDTPPVDALTALATMPGELSWLVPRTGSLEIGGTSIDTPEGAAPAQVALLERHGGEIRVGVWLDHVRFAVWTDYAWLLGTIVAPTVVRGDVPDVPDRTTDDPIEVVLEPGAHVRRLARKDGQTRVRYLGALEVDGWVPDAAIADRAAPIDPIGRIYDGHPTLTVTPGGVIRSEPKWASRALAVMSNGYFVDELAEVDDSWVEVRYHDGELLVHGYYGKHDPPEATHQPHQENPPATTKPNAMVASGTCLYARARGDAVGFVVGDRSVLLEPAGDGWWTLTTDTPWGPIAFAAQGVTGVDLAACAPAGSVPPPKPPATP